MENPASWTEVELVISEALDRADRAIAEGRIGGSRAIQIAEALRKAGLIASDAPTEEIGWDRLREHMEARKSIDTCDSMVWDGKDSLTTD